VVTEYGVAHLLGKSIRERVIELANVAHPDYRNEILNEAKRRRYVYADQKVSPVSPYPEDLERVRTTADGTELFCRPIKPTDDKMLRDLLYSLSERSIAFRFFKPIKAFPHKFVQEFTHVDYARDMAIIGLIKDTGGERIVGVGRYFLDPNGKKAELSFLVRDDWQARGIGSDLLAMLIEIARKRGIAVLEANVLSNNYQMLGVFANSGYAFTTRRVEDMYQVSLRLTDPPSVDIAGGR
jgi:RimJ/RimL family protein N-acetyltransferase